jgi:hypothetical protein
VYHLRRLKHKVSLVQRPGLVSQDVDTLTVANCLECKESDLPAFTPGSIVSTPAFPSSSLWVGAVVCRCDLPHPAALVQQATCQLALQARSTAAMSSPSPWKFYSCKLSQSCEPPISDPVQQSKNCYFEPVAQSLTLHVPRFQTSRADAE